MKKIFTILAALLFLSLAVHGQRGNGSSEPCSDEAAGIQVGASRTSLYFPLLKGKKIGVVGNQGSLIPVRKGIPGAGGRRIDTLSYVHLVDSLVSAGFEVCKVFSPEHGFRGQAEAGAEVGGQTDCRTGLPVVSLYGASKKPSSRDLEGIELMVFDLQDVGVRFYTYISTLHYVMEACADAGIPVVVLDRPNPHDAYVDGPVLDTLCCRSFVGMHPVPVVYGMTIGEYARMIQGQSWLKSRQACRLEVIPVGNYQRGMPYDFPVWPSPNLRSMKAVRAYPSLCLLEGTPVSMGRGTWHPFECYGFAGCPEGDFRFTPRSIPGLSLDPPFKDQECTGYEVKETDSGQALERIDLQPLFRMYRAYPGKEDFFRPFFDKLAGTPRLAQAIREGRSEAEIRAGWKADLLAFDKIRRKYLLYP